VIDSPILPNDFFSFTTTINCSPYSKIKKEVDKEKLKLSIHFKGERAGRQRKKKTQIH
jgi:hypothetical protein